MLLIVFVEREDAEEAMILGLIIIVEGLLEIADDEVDRLRGLETLREKEEEEVEDLSSLLLGGERGGRMEEEGGRGV